MKVRWLRLRSSSLKSVGMKLFLIFFVSIFAMVAITGTTSYFISKNVIKSKVADASLQTIVQASQKLDLYFSNLSSFSEKISNESQVRETLLRYTQAGDNSGEAAEAASILMSKVGSLIDKEMAAFAFYELDGKEIAAVNTKLLDSAPEWFESIVDADGEAAWLPTMPNGYVNKGESEGFVLGRLIKDASEGAKPVILVIEYRTTQLEDLMSGVDLGYGSKRYVTDEKDRYVYDPNPEFIGETAAIRMEGKEARTSLYDMVSGERQLVVGQLSEVTGWRTVGTVPLAELLKEAQQIASVTIGMVVLALIVAAGVGYGVIRFIGRPLAKVSSSLQEGASGNLSVRLVVNRSDEIGEVSESFNEMMENIGALVRATSHSAQEVLGTSVQLSDASRRTSQSAREISTATEEIAAGATSLALEAEQGADLSPLSEIRCSGFFTPTTRSERQPLT